MNGLTLAIVCVVLIVLFLVREWFTAGDDDLL